MSQSVKEALYNVECVDCGAVWQPLFKSSLWWQAKQREEKGFLDALRVSGRKCGCVKTPIQANAPFRVFGYDMECIEFDMPFFKLSEALKAFIEIKKTPDIVFITGISKAVQERLDRIF
jgi:hypothetical protein